MLKRFRGLILLNVIGLLLVLTVNFLANALPIAGKTTGELSDLYPNAFTPSGFTFSIWGIIYLALLLFIVYLVKEGWQQGGKAHPYLHAIGSWFFLSCLANASWIFAWHYEWVVLSFLIMLAILATLTVIYVRLRQKAPIPSDTWTKLAVFLPFSLYLGWICVATIANATALLVDLGWTGGSIPPSSWAAGMMIVAVILTLFFQWQFNDWPFTLVTCWALYGISARYLPDWQLISIVGVAGIGLLILIQLFRWTQKKLYPVEIG